MSRTARARPEAEIPSDFSGGITKRVTLLAKRREGWRENGKVRKRIIANLSSWPMEKVETLRRLLKNEPLVGRDGAFDIVRSLPHGHVAAVLGTLTKLGLDRLIDPKPSHERDQVLAMIVARIL